MWRLQDQHGGRDAKGRRCPRLPVVLGLLAGLGAVGCGDGGPGALNLLGTFDVTYDYRLERTGASEARTCFGTLVIADQSADRFSGTYGVLDSADCDADGGRFSGSYDLGGSVVIFDLFSKFPGLTEERELCGAGASGAEMTGKLSGDRLTVTGRESVRCSADFGDVDQVVTLTIAGERS